MFPQELISVNNWCVYKLIEDIDNPEKPKKVPINAKTGGNAMSNNSSTWCDYETAVKALENGVGEGLGFFFSPPYFGVDIDGVDDEIQKYKDGDPNNIVSEFVYSLGSYAEYSLSGKGIHIICKGELPQGGRRKTNVEMYSEGRYFIMTGNIASEYTDIVDCTESIKYLHAKYIGTLAVTKNSETNSIGNLNLDEEQLIEIALKSKQGQAFNTLYQGFWEGLYPSQSEADLAFANMLAFWTGADKLKMDSIFRKSGLYRQKWDSKRGSSTYGEYILNKAIADCREVFNPGQGVEDYGVIILLQIELH